MAKLKTLFLAMMKVKNWWKVVVDSVRKKKGERYYLLTNGGVVVIRKGTSDVGIFKEVVLHDCYGVESMEKEGRIKDGCVVDVGACNGLFSMMAVMKGARKVVCYEPLRMNEEFLRANVELAVKHFNPKCEVDIEFKAVDGEVGRKGVMLIDEENYGASRMKKGEGNIINEGDQRKEVECETESINDIIDRLIEVDVLKIDCEGCEHEIIGKINDENWEKIKCLVMEVHRVNGDDGNGEEGEGEDEVESLVRYVEGKGYSSDFDGNKYGKGVKEVVVRFVREN